MKSSSLFRKLSKMWSLWNRWGRISVFSPILKMGQTEPRELFGDKEVTNDHTEISFNWEGAVWKPQYSKSSTDKANAWIWGSQNGLEKQTCKQAPLPWHLERQGFKQFDYELRKNNSMEAREGKLCFYDGIILYVLIAWWERDGKWEVEVQQTNGRRLWVKWQETQS